MAPGGGGGKLQFCVPSLKCLLLNMCDVYDHIQARVHGGGGPKGPGPPL